MAERKKRERPAFNKDVAAAISSHYNNVQTKKPLAYALMSSNPLIEVAYAAGIQPAFPENYACVCAARHVSKEYCGKAETHRYAQDLCSYCKNNLGYLYSADKNPPMGGIGEPDLLLMTSSACTHYFKWWDLLHEIYHKPLIFVNTPRVMEPDAIPDYYVDFAQREIEEAIVEMEKILGTDISHKRLAQTVRQSDQVVQYWQKLLELQKNVPSPLGLSDLTNALFVLIVLAGTREGVELMKKIYHETARLVEEEKGVLTKGEEKHRLLWLNIPFWYNLKLFGYFEDRGCVFPISDYGKYIWGTTRMDGDQPIESLARKALGGELNTSVDAHMDRILEDIRSYRIDGVIAHSNKSCRVLSVGALDVIEVIRKTLNIPVLILDGDHADERVYSEVEVMTRIDTFLDMLG
jgi:benzoyl-CoA reductase/2-hydroxyglutaryl-CoA dehydratase subunit BcrC/BadD/HgdB